MWFYHRNGFLSYSDYKIVKTINFQWSDLLTTKQAMDIQDKFNKEVERVLSNPKSYVLTIKPKLMRSNNNHLKVIKIINIAKT